MQKLLALNRGEIAIRILRAANELGLRTVAVYSAEDRLSLHRFKADEAYLIGVGKGPVQAYLDVDGIVALAAEKGVDRDPPRLWLPGRKSGPAASVRQAGITFVGPSGDLLSSWATRPPPGGWPRRPASRRPRHGDPLTDQKHAREGSRARSVSR